MISKFVSRMGAGALMALTMSAGVASAQSVEWDTSNALAVGSSCNSNGPFADTYFISAGNDATVIFTNFGIDLSAPSDGDTAIHSCLVRIPVKVGANVAIGTLTQQMHWGYSKDRGTEAEVYSNATFFGRPTTKIRRHVGTRVRGVESFLTEEVTDSYLHMSGMFCRSRPQRGLFQVNLGVSARRESSSRSISVRLIGEDLRYEVLAEWVHC